MSNGPVDRRTVLLGAAGVLGSLGGCISTSAEPPGQDDDGGGGGGGGGNSNVSPLRLGGSSTVYPIVNEGGSYWNSNPPADDEEYWGPSQYGIATTKNLADYWAGLYGFESPFSVTVGLSHSGTGLEKIRNDQIDIGNASAPVAAELPDASEEELENYVNHVVGVDAQPIVVSRAIYDAGVTQLTGDQVRAIYRGEITNWSEIPSYEGPGREIQAVGRSVGSGTDTAFRANLLGDPEAEMPGVDIRKGQNQQVQQIVGQSDNAVAYLALAFVTDQVRPIALDIGGSVYRYGENLSDPDYPLSRDLHCYTWQDTSKKEAAFLRMVISDFGQQNFVTPKGYAALTDERQEEELAKLPEPADV